MASVFALAAVGDAPALTAALEDESVDVNAVDKV